jgi:hypothetical protein
MKRLIEYTYNSWTESCGCCGDSSSTYSMWEDGKLIHEDDWCELCENEEELREALKHLEPFDVSADSYWFREGK